MTAKTMRNGDAPATKADLRRLDARLSKRLDAHDGNLHRLNVGFARIEGRMTDLEGKMDSLLTLKTEFAVFQTILIKMSQNQETFLRRWAYHDDMLMDHEKRLGKVESRLQ